MPLRWILSIFMTVNVFVSSSLFAEEASSSSQPAATAAEIPQGFDRAVPKSVRELKEMQEHLTALIPHLHECTVNLQVGGAQGSGVIVDPRGYIITAAHVVGSPGNKARITMPDGRRYSGVTLGRNRALDAALVKLESDREDWPHCEMSEELPQPGDWCMVIAHPGGYQASRGLVLRLGRVILENSWLVQTDCELVGGDSGGPLFGVDGKVIGVNTRIGESTDLNFHVPVSAYTRHWDRYLAGEDFRTHSGAYLGVTGVVKPGTVGMEVTEVYPGDPADRAGVRKGDVLMTFQSKKVTSMQELVEMVGNEMPGKTVRLGIVRDEETLDIQLRLGMRWD